MVVIMAFAGTAFAQKGMGTGAVIYRQATEASLTGTVEAVGQLQPNGLHGVHLALRTESALLDVYVGPAWFAKQHNFEFAKGDAVSVTGSRVVIGGQNALVAREIKIGEEVLTLRNADGFPLWAGGAETVAPRARVSVIAAPSPSL